MHIAATIIAALAIAVGLAGIVIPVLPGLVIVFLAVLVWALLVQHAIGWVVLTISLALALAGWFLQYIVPGRQLARFGIPSRTLIIGVVAGIVGFFVIPLIGLPIGFVLGVFGAEYARLGNVDQAWPSAVQALRAALVSYGIELTAALLIAISFGVGAYLLLTGAWDGSPAGVV
ncbi:MAG: DUF456 domain-containing protein [Mobilicoccus sp.]|nr:DUF456 domain-containing protein [Mobilicoccus sp.]